MTEKSTSSWSGTPEKPSSLADIHLAGAPQARAFLRTVLNFGSLGKARLAGAERLQAFQGAPLAAPIVFQIGGYFFGVAEAFGDA